MQLFCAKLRHWIMRLTPTVVFSASGALLSAGDALRLADNQPLHIGALEEAEILLLDLPAPAYPISRQDILLTSSHQ